MVRILPIRTGSVRIRPSQVRAIGHGEERLRNLFADGAWTEKLPILAWAILHPEGVIVVDTGETARAIEPGYYPMEHPYYRHALRVEVAAQDEIGAQLRTHGIALGDVRAVLLTHLHTDHAGGLHDFQGANIWVHTLEHENSRGDAGLARGYLPHRLPTWFTPRFYTFNDDLVGPFGRSHRVTKSGDVRVVETPGHTSGHVSVVVEFDDMRYFIAGDATYSEASLLDQAVDGISPDEAQALATIQNIGAYVGAGATVYLPSHDVQSVARLEARAVTVARQLE